MRLRTCIPAALTAGLIAAIGIAPAAVAHVTVSPESASAGEYAHLDFSVGHGCEGSPTTSLRVRVPESVVSVTPQVKQGWDIQTVEGPKESTELHGETITKGVSEVIWTATGEPLADNRLEVFGMSVSLPDAAGDTIYFPVIQNCESGMTRWIEVPAEDESTHELEEPAPALALTAQSEDGGHEGGAAASNGEGSDDGDGVSGLSIAALIVGGLGFLMGGASLARSRKS